jgi:hypothetical protein
MAVNFHLESSVGAKDSGSKSKPCSLPKALEPDAVFALGSEDHFWRDNPLERFSIKEAHSLRPGRSWRIPAA